MSKPQVCG